MLAGETLTGLQKGDFTTLRVWVDDDGSGSPGFVDVTSLTGSSVHNTVQAGGGINVAQNGSVYTVTNTAQGQVGATGSQGSQGPPGIKGDTGDQGLQGASGQGGAPGPQGNTGGVGATGQQGPQGPQGPIGLTGATGQPGSQGVQGAHGDLGPQGPIGLTGAASTIPGPQGIQGVAGPPGPSVTGPAGQDATNHIHCDDGQGNTVDIYNPTILSFQNCTGTTMGSTVALVFLYYRRSLRALV